MTWDLIIGFLIGVIASYSFARKQGYIEAIDDLNRKDTSDALASYINQMAKGINNDNTDET